MRSSMSRRRSGDEKHGHLSKLLQSAEHVAGLTADLPSAKPRHHGETARDQQGRDQADRCTEADDQRRKAEAVHRPLRSCRPHAPAVSGA